MDEQDIARLFRVHASKLMPELNPSVSVKEDYEPRVFEVNIFDMQGKYASSYLLDFNRRSSYRGNFAVSKSCEGRRIGGRLVLLREDVCRYLNFENILITSNTNPSFWSHMGYVQPDFITNTHLVASHRDATAFDSRKPFVYKSLKE